MKVAHFQRRPFSGQFSIERVFDSVRFALPAGIECQVHTSPQYSQGIFPRLANIRAAAQCHADVNHITGDVHYLALGLEGRKTLLTIHDCVSLERLRGLKRTVFRLCWYTLPIRRARVVTVVSDSVRQELLRHVNCAPQKIRVVHNCLTNNFKPSPKPFNEREPSLLQIGTGKNKNLETVIRALSGVNCRLNIIGPLSTSQLALLREARVQYSNLAAASEAQVLQAYHESDLVLFASTYEGFGLPIIEANAIGRPVITSNILSMPEVAGDAACLVDPFKEHEIREGVLRILKNQGYRNDLIACGFRNVRRFEPATIAAQYASIYDELSEHA